MTIIHSKPLDIVLKDDGDLVFVVLTVGAFVGDGGVAGQMGLKGGSEGFGGLRELLVGGRWGVWGGLGSELKKHTG